MQGAGQRLQQAVENQSLDAQAVVGDGQDGLVRVLVADELDAELPGGLDPGDYCRPLDVAQLRELGILLDKDDDGYLLQIFTQTVIGPRSCGASLDET